MTDDEREDPTTVALVTRTLFASGFAITEASRQPNHIEYQCSRPDAFGVDIPYTILVFGSQEPGRVELEAATAEIHAKGRQAVVVAETGGKSWLSLEEFVDVLGGPVPTWRALNAEYRQRLIESSENRPDNSRPEPWQVFETAVADGLEFITGMRARRLGGTRRGLRVSDILVQTPDFEVILVDAKASIKAFDAGWSHLRALVEYTKNQIRLQHGTSHVVSALLAAASFKQGPKDLVDTSGEFINETGVPLSFIKATEIADLVERMAPVSDLRRAVNWRRVLSCVGTVQPPVIEDELARIALQRLGPNGPRG